uniref:Uncharacterized protein n=1 Tax=Oncorhynchus mykiss TaxID=8022 RepID=A0A8L0DMD1_ONCMY
MPGILQMADAGGFFGSFRGPAISFIRSSSERRTDSSSLPVPQPQRVNTTHVINLTLRCTLIWCTGHYRNAMAAHTTILQSLDNDTEFNFSQSRLPNGRAEACHTLNVIPVGGSATSWGCL